ncbi:MAG: CHAD domain-containing protein [Acidobacteriaceae bacterium]
MAFDLGRVEKDIRKLRRFLKHAPKHTPPKKVHSLRTAIRRFEAAMQALALDSHANERRLLRKLAKLRKRAGKVRDLDVLTGYVADLHVSGEEKCRGQLLKYLGAKHADRSGQLHSFAVEHGESVRRRLKRTAMQLAASTEDVATSQTAPGDTMLSELRLERQLTQPIRLTKSNLHPYRLQVKELLYMLQMETEPADRELVEILGEVKDSIGEWHDWLQLQTIAGDHLAHGSKCKLLLLLEKTTDEKLKHALTVANAGRKHMQQSSAGMHRQA